MRDCMRWWMTAITMVGAIGLCITGCRQEVPEASETIPSVAAFLERHWQLPVPLQGAPPKSYTPLEASLHPKDCGICHPQQYQDWQTTLHRQSMSPGLYGQLIEMADTDPATYTLCSNCHTPLQEQLPFVEHDGRYQPNPAFDQTLQHSGLVCAACHMRQHQLFGPPRRSELPPLPPDTKLPHGGFTVNAAYEQSAFCQPCHQFEADGFALNDKLIENTYEEWRQSRYAADGTHCQTCHMPDRRHLWRGIHDPDMVRQAMTVTITPEAASYAPGDRIRMDVTVANTGAGHFFPTYVTPKIFVYGQLLDALGQVITGTSQRFAIGREVELDLSREVYDTRIPPHGRRTMTYTQVVPLEAKTLRVRIVVHPDHFYRQFFEAVLAHGGGGKGRAQLQQALRQAEASVFTAFEREIDLAAARSGLKP